MRVVELARDRVVVTMRGLLATPPDDRFLHSAIYTGRVQRRTDEHGAEVWTPCLDDGGSLSQWVLSLFASDALSHRERYDESLSVCEVCGTIGFDLESRSRHRCAVHDLVSPRSSSRHPTAVDIATERTPPASETKAR